MTFEDELGNRLARRAGAVDAQPDLAGIEAGVQRRRRRNRGLAATGAVAAVALSIGGVVVTSTDGGDRIASTSANDADEPSTSESAEVVPVATDAPAPPAESLPPVPGTEPAEPVVPEIEEPAPDATAAGTGADRAEQYFDRTTEVYRRDVPGGRELVVRRSDLTFAELFGYTWRAPTGSAELCLPHGVMLFGEPGRSVAVGSAWVAVEIRQVTSPLTALYQLRHEDGFTSFLVTTDSGATEIVAESVEGVELDRAPVANEIAVLAVRNRELNLDSALGPRLTLVGDGSGASYPLGELGQIFLTDVPAECSPGSPPTLSFPSAGEQPADPVAAEAEVRATHALLVDQTIPDEERPDDLLDDVTGVAEAFEMVRSGTFADSAASARYTIDDFVFTTPTEAWFEYTIDAPTGVFAQRYGIARFDGAKWKITRTTICQDLALAGGTCTPLPDPQVIQPPVPPGWDEALREFYELASLYIAYDGCGPLSQC